MSFGETLWKAWAEVFFIILLVLGFLVSLSIQSTALNYTVIFCAGLMIGRTIFMKQGKQPLFPFFLIIIGFLLGYTFGGYIQGLSRTLVVLLFIIGAILSYYLHKKEYIPS